MQQINDLSGRILSHKAKIDAAFQRVLCNGWFVHGREVQSFEENFATYLGTNHCISVGNGTDAIELGLKAIGVKKNDKIATNAHAGMYCTQALFAIGALPHYFDIDLASHSPTAQGVAQAIANGATGVVVTHLYGRAIPEIARIAAICKESKIPLLEDCAQAHGALIDGIRVGNFGDAASFSFYPTKNLGALGDGGAVATNRLEVANEVRLLRQYGWRNKYSVERANARNSRLDEIQAAFLNEFLPDLEVDNDKRRAIANRYSAQITHPLVCVPPRSGAETVAHLYVVLSSQRESLKRHLASNQIAAETHYPIPDHRQPVFGRTFERLCLPNTETLAAQALTLPCYPMMPVTAVEAVINAVNTWRI
jgi:dTDP-3-amino-2,3,6-trideoxy-4-keto-D-glucose/dTDP-3-amino-3,4,6-trideoxy-alpha-D-glucose/dTDP-2,6-dideoxy-D-kanosamine transaminase